MLSPEGDGARMPGDEVLSGSFNLDPDVIYERLDGRLVLVHLRTNRIYELSATGARFCELLLSGCSPAAGLEILAREYDTSCAVIRDEIRRLLEKLSQDEIVRRS